MFERQDQTVPQSQRPITRLPSFKQLTASRETSSNTQELEIEEERTKKGNQRRDDDADSASEESDLDESVGKPGLISEFAARDTTDRLKTSKPPAASEKADGALSRDKQRLVRKLGKVNHQPSCLDEYDDPGDVPESDAISHGASRAVQDFNARLAEQAIAGTQPRDPRTPGEENGQVSVAVRTVSPAPTSSVVQNAFDRMRPRRRSPEVATITIGERTTTTILGPSVQSQRKPSPTTPNSIKQRGPSNDTTREKFSSSMQSFAAPGSSGSTLIKTIGVPQSRPTPSKRRLHMTSDNEPIEGGLSSSSDDGENVGEDEDEPSRSEEDASVGLSGSESDADYVDEGEKKVMEEAKVAEMIRQAENAASLPSEDRAKRAQQALKGHHAKDSTRELIQTINLSIENINAQLSQLENAVHSVTTQLAKPPSSPPATPASPSDPTAPDLKTLTITKSDFSTLQILGQFNLGFILATRNNTDLFIIDQHASDEKINFERLQATTVMQNQRLVHPLRLELTAVDEEIVLESQDALLRNGFVVDVDESGEFPVGQRVSLISLPMSKETTFSPSDLEELIALLADAPPSNSSNVAATPRPSKIRKLLAMRACRSSVMIGKVMTRGMMRRLVGRMGQIDKPWNCPHGRPTMRHVCGLEGLGKEAGHGDEFGRIEGIGGEEIDWRAWMEGMEVEDEEDEEVAEYAGDEEMEGAETRGGEMEDGDAEESDLV